MEETIQTNAFNSFMRAFLHREQGIDNFESMPYFKKALDMGDGASVLGIYEILRQQCEILKNPKELERVARMYNDQHFAFQDILFKQGFELVGKSESVQPTYEGRIAFLTSFGTLAILGRPIENKRYVQMTRLHSKNLSYEGARCKLNLKLQLQMPPYMDVLFTNGKNWTNYNNSKLRGLAINLDGPIGKELETSNAIELITDVHQHTWLGWENPIKRAQDINV